MESQNQRRSGCPVSISLEILGDRWSLLIVRDMMVRGHKTFKQFQESGEGIATNILADRLQKLVAGGLITAEKDQLDARRVNYRLTEQGIDLAPMMLELLIWGARHRDTGLPNAWIEQVARNRVEFLAEVRRRWEAHDSTPMIPRFADTSKVLSKNGDVKRRRNVRPDESAGVRKPKLVAAKRRIKTNSHVG